MNPTFVGNGASERLGSDYGVIDKDRGAKKNVKRFQIVTTQGIGHIDSGIGEIAGFIHILIYIVLIVFCNSSRNRAACEPSIWA